MKFKIGDSVLMEGKITAIDIDPVDGLPYKVSTAEGITWAKESELRELDSKPTLAKPERGPAVLVYRKESDTPIFGYLAGDPVTPLVILDARVDERGEVMGKVVVFEVTELWYAGQEQIAEWEGTPSDS